MRTDMELMNRLFHAALRRDLERAIGSLTASRRPSPAQRAAVAEHVGLVLDLLHHHHTSEDIGLWPLVRRRAPDLGSQLDLWRPSSPPLPEPSFRLGRPHDSIRRPLILQQPTTSGRRSSNSMACCFPTSSTKRPRLCRASCGLSRTETGPRCLAGRYVTGVSPWPAPGWYGWPTG